MKVNFNRIVIPNDKEWIRNILTNLLRCKICLNILNNPYDCLCCNQTFCKSCIFNYFKANNKCPYGDYFKNENEKKQLPPTDTLRQSGANIRNVVNSLKFYCVNREAGCNVELSIEGLDEHEKTCGYKQTKIIFNKKRNLEKTKAFNGLEGLENLNEKEKFKFQDSCMSFRNVDPTNIDSGLHNIQNNNNNTIANSNQKTNGNPFINIQGFQNNANTISNNENDIENNNNLNYTNYMLETLTSKVNELSSFIYSCYSDKNTISQSKEIVKSKNGNINKKGISSSNILSKIPKKKMEIHMSPRKKEIKLDDVESTPKFKKIPHKEIYNTTTDFVLSSSATCANFRTSLINNSNVSISNKHDNKLFSEIKKLNNKVTYIERLVQSNSALESQQYIIQTKRNSCDVNDVSKSFSTQVSSFDLKLTPSKKSLQTINKSTINSSKNIRKKITEDINKQINNSTRTLNENKFPTKDYIDTYVVSRFEEMKQFIEEHCINELKTYFLEISMDNVNLFIEKLNEFTQTIESHTIS